MLSRNLKIILAITIVSMLLASGFFIINNGNSSTVNERTFSSSNTGIVNGSNAVLITIYNNQSAATSTPFQQELVVNSTIYSAYENSNLSNVRFSYLNGSIIPSWLESGNSYSDNNTVYWLNLVGIKADSSINIYMVFLPLGEIAFNGINVGEASQLSGSFGSNSFGIYNDISNVMERGLIYQFYTGGGSTGIIPSTSEIVDASLSVGVSIPSIGGISTVNPMASQVQGTAQVVAHGYSEQNVIVNYAYGYSGNPFPNPPVSSPGSEYAVKLIGWFDANGSTGVAGAWTDDGVFCGVSTTGGISSGSAWVPNSESANTYKDWAGQATTDTQGTISSGTYRIQIGYFNAGGSADLAIYSSEPLKYYHANLPPNGIMPAASFSAVHSVYHISISGSGLPSQNYQWNMSMKGYSLFTFKGDSSITVYLPNGTYYYNVSSLNKTYAPTVHSGQFTVSGASASVPISFYNVVYQVSFKEVSSLLPPGTEWFVNITGSGNVSLNSVSSSVATNLSNGTYVARYASVDGNQYLAGGVNFSVAGSNLTFHVNFSKAYKVTYNETGLDLGNGNQWYVNLTNFLSFNSSASSLIAYEINGTYNYTIGTINKIFKAPSGNVTVKGVNQTVNVTFSKVLYQVTFTRTGYSVPGTWYVNSTSWGSISGTSTSLYTNLTNGSYNYSPATDYKVYSASPGNFPVNGSAKTVTVAFHPIEFKATFTQTGLPSGEFWYVNVTSVGQNPVSPTSHLVSSGVSTSVSLINGTYNYTVQTGNKTYAAASHTSQFNVPGANVSIALTFYPVTYEINFKATGFSVPVTWYLNNSQVHLTSSSSIISAQLTNGTHIFNVATSNYAYAPFLTTLAVEVNGHSANFTVAFTEKITSVTLTITNLTSSVTTWYLNLSNGMSILVHGQSVSFDLPYGSYTFKIGIPGAGTVYSGSINADQPAVNLAIFVNNYSTAGPLSNSAPALGDAAPFACSNNILDKEVSQ